ncbi:hypothetical protein [Pseudonocardia acidicola]|uniref:Fusaric acid resistance family protein n=1 Tax=Pseudonocardia acidicola TaxID=2724939 RepID=A0ABX1S6P3_9PSEU|nr:hypothetical protein [Pseudonocardia acidicola]NMH95914.1 hypothetical protein [Pseudonocardia acidicola]
MLLPCLLALPMLVTAEVFDLPAVLFPEGIALALGIWVLQKPAWLRSRVQIATVPPACALLGVLVVRLPGPRWVLAVLALVLGVALLQAVRCQLAPALSAAVLPVLFDIRGWPYPVAVLLLCAVLAMTAPRPSQPQAAARWSTPVLGVFGVCAVGCIAAAGLIGLRPLVVAPPLLVACFEWVTIGARPLCSGIRRWLLLVAAGVVGAGAAAVIPPAWVAGTVAVAVAALLCAVLAEPLTPALATALVPLVAHVPDPWVVGTSVALGAAVLHMAPVALRASWRDRPAR